MHIICPHCENPIEVVDLASDEVLCSSCGSSFHLERGTTTGWQPRDGQRKLGKFELLEAIGMGSFGTVYKARDTELDRVVAVKVPRAGNLGSKGEADRFLRELRVSRKETAWPYPARPCNNPQSVCGGWRTGRGKTRQSLTWIWQDGTAHGGIARRAPATLRRLCVHDWLAKLAIRGNRRPFRVAATRERSAWAHALRYHAAATR